MPSCSIITCRSRSQNTTQTRERISYHRFPNNPFLKEKWMDATGRNNWFPTKNSTICSQHFREDDYEIKKSDNKYLREGAIPTENVVQIYSASRESSSSANITNTQEEIVKKPTLIKINEESSPRKCDLNTTSDDDTVTRASSPDTPRRRKLKQIIISRESMIKRQKAKIRKIQAQNRRLKIKIVKIGDLINDLQQKFLVQNENINTLNNILQLCAPLPDN